MRTVRNPAPSGAGDDAHLCANYATVIWNRYHFVELPLIVVRGGTLDNPALAPPTYQIFTRSKQPWFERPAGASAFDRWREPGERQNRGQMKVF